MIPHEQMFIYIAYMQPFAMGLTYLMQGRLHALHDRRNHGQANMKACSLLQALRFLLLLLRIRLKQYRTYSAIFESSSLSQPMA